MTTYFIDASSSNASDKNTGLSAATPLASLDAVNRLKLQPGDTVAFKAGTTYASTATGTASLLIKASGTSDQPITFTSYGEGPAPIIKNLASGYSDAIQLNGAKYVTIEGLNITGAGQAGINIDKNSSFVTVRNVEASGVGEGVMMNGSNSLVTQSFFHDLKMIKNTTSLPDDDYGAVGVMIGGSNNEVSFTRIVNAAAPSYDYGRDGGGIELFGTISNISIHDNWVENSIGFLEAGGIKGAISNVTITNNVSLNNGNFIDLHNGGGQFASTFANVDASNNTIVNENNAAKAIGTVFLDAAYKPGQINFHDNVVYLNSGDSVFKQTGDYHSNNTFYLASSATHLYNNWVMTLNAGENYGKLSGTASGAALVAAVQSQSGRGADLTSADQTGLAPKAPAAAESASGSGASSAPMSASSVAGPVTTDSYDIKGQSYTSEHKVVGSDGSVLLLERYHADGTKDSSQTKNADGSTTFQTYDASGLLVKSAVAMADGARVVDTYRVTGQNYVTSHETYDRAGIQTSVSQYRADGTKVYTSLLNADGSLAASTYDVAGKPSVTSVKAASGATSTTWYDADGGIKQTSQKTAAGIETSLVTYHADGTKDFSRTLNADGSTKEAKYDAAGRLSVETVTDADGSSAMSWYDAKGALTQTTHKDADGVGSSLVTFRADGTKDISRVVGSDGSTTSSQYDTSGKLKLETIAQKDGSSVVHTFNGAGLMTQSVETHKDGSSDVYQFNIVGKSYNSSHVSYDASKNLEFAEMFNNDGTHTVNVLASGVTVAATAAKDTFTSYGGDTFVFDKASGKDVIYGFHAGSSESHDTIALDKSIVSDFSHLHLRQAGADVVIDLTAQDTITLKSVSLASLTHHDFLFT